MKKTFIGTVVSTKMNKTVVVAVKRTMRHRVYKKVVTRHKKYKAHNEKLELKTGDIVKIQETRPLSKEKHFLVVGKV